MAILELDSKSSASIHSPDSNTPVPEPIRSIAFIKNYDIFLNFRKNEFGTVKFIDREYLNFKRENVGIHITIFYSDNNNLYSNY